MTTTWPDLAALPTELVSRYETRVPRYTSYPTAPHFAPVVDPGPYLERIRATSAAATPAPLSIYVHVPFCPSRCLYCGCHTVVIEREDEPSCYLGEVLRERDLWLDLLGPGRTAAQLALGGGSPATLGARGLARLVTALDEVFPPRPDAERSIELDPERIDEAFLDQALDLGFTRISFGIQDFDQEVLSRVGRRENPAKVSRLLGHLRGRGFEAVSFDLMIGLPGQTPATFETTLRQVIAQGPGRLALFPYAHVPWMRPHQQALERWTIPDTGDRLRLYALAHRLLGEAGYAPIGMDHFARPGDELMEAASAFRLHRNFMGYTTRPGLDQIALGVSAISDLGGVYAQNVKDVETYQQRLAAGVLPLDRGFLMSGEDRLRRDVIMGLLCNFQVDLQPLAAGTGRTVAEAFGPELARLAPLVEDGLLHPFGPEGQLRVTTTGLPFVRLVCAVFDQYLAPQAAELRYSTSL